MCRISSLCRASGTFRQLDPVFGESLPADFNSLASGVTSQATCRLRLLLESISMAISVVQTIGRRYLILLHQPTSVGFANSQAGVIGCDPSATGFFDINCNSVTLSSVRYWLIRPVRTGIAGRNTLRAPAYNTFDMSLQRSFKIPFTPMEEDRFEIRFELFQRIQHADLPFRGRRIVRRRRNQPLLQPAKFEFRCVGWCERRSYGKVTVTIRVLIER